MSIMYKRSLIPIAMMLVTVGGWLPSLGWAGQWHEASIDAGGMRRWYRTYVPDGLQKSAPLLLSLHGGTGSMHTIDKGPTQGWVRVADEQGFLLLVPNGSNMKTGTSRGKHQFWNDLRDDPGESQTDADDLAFLEALLDRVQTEYGTDPGRVYVTGNSNGGLMTYRLLIEMPGRFAAAAAFIANIPVNSSRLRVPETAVPLMIWSGTDDKMMKYGGGDIPGKRGHMRSTPDNLDWWIKANRADPRGERAEVLPDVDPSDGCRVVRKHYPALQGGAPILFYLAKGGGHAMPSQYDYGSEAGPIYKLMVGRTCKDVDGADIAWEFMSQYSAGSVVREPGAARSRTQGPRGFGKP